MKGKACARCRQCKLRCDSDMAAPASCSRCRGVNAVCVMDTNYQRVSKTRRLMELEAEVTRVRQQNQSQSLSQNQNQNPLAGLGNIGPPVQEPPPFDFASYQASQLQQQESNSHNKASHPVQPLRLTRGKHNIRFCLPKESQNYIQPTSSSVLRRYSMLSHILPPMPSMAGLFDSHLSRGCLCQKPSTVLGHLCCVLVDEHHAQAAAWYPRNDW